MKTLINYLLFFITFLCSTQITAQGNVGIGTSNPDNSALLELQSTSKGILVPRMDSLQRVSINSPAIGLLVYETGSSTFLTWTGIKWQRLNQEDIIINKDGDTWVSVQDSDIIKMYADNKLALEMYNDQNGDTHFSTGNGILKNIFFGAEVGTSNTSGTDNTIFGDYAFENNLSGNQNVAFGTRALNENLGFYNTGIGCRSLENNKNGWRNVALGYAALQFGDSLQNNVAIGHEALRFSKSGSDNIAIGAFAAAQDTSGKYNIFIGEYSGYQNNQDNNIGIGQNVLGSNMGAHNLGVGHYVLLKNTTGQNNTSYGNSSLRLNESGSNNVAVGKESLFSDTTGNSNTAIGYQTLLFNTNGSGNVAIGNEAGRTAQGSNKLYIENSDSSMPLIWGDFANDSIKIYGNLSIGDQYSFPTSDGLIGQFLKTDGNGNLNWNSATVLGLNELTDAKTNYTNNNMFLGSGSGGAQSGGTGNLGIGINSLYNNSAGDTNIAIGNNVLYDNTTGDSNVAIGNNVLYDNTTGFTNVAVGHGVLNKNTIGQSNTAMGSQAMGFSISPTHCTAIGKYSLLVANGRENVALGFNSDRWNENGDYNTIIGSNAGSGLSSFSRTGAVYLGYNAGRLDTTDNKLYIENSDSGTPLIWGDFSTDSLNFNGKVRINCTSSSHDFINTEINNEPALIPSTTNYGYLGSSSHTFFKTYSNYFYAGDVANYLTYSDRRIKENVIALQSQKDKFLALRPVQYDIKKSHYLVGRSKTPKEEVDRKNQMGFIAQEVEALYPGLVKTDENTGLKSMSYQGLVPVLVDVVQKQEKQIQELTQKVDQLLQMMEEKD